MRRMITMVVMATALACGSSNSLGPPEHSSPDGYRWQLLTAAAEWPPQRALQHTVSFDERIWLMEDEVGYWRTEDGSEQAAPGRSALTRC